jgi:glycosyltransferase involved in cell wall biosynthesis
MKTLRIEGTSMAPATPIEIKSGTPSSGGCPKVSVVMPVFNQEKYVAEAMRSILEQNFEDFEFVIVDDGSTDRTLEIIRQFDDPRIRLVRKEHDGFITTLVRGYQEARGQLIARMDSDDLCRADRLDLQVSFLEKHPECAFVGTAYGYVTPNGKCLEPRSQFEWRYVEPAEITLGGRVFGDPTVVFRRDVGEKVGFYDPEFNNENPLWYRLLREFKGAVLGEPLYLGRWLVTSLSRSSSLTFVGGSPGTTAFHEIRVKYDPENAVKLERKPPRPFKMSLTGKLKHGLVIYLAAGDRLAAVRLTWDGWKIDPFSLVRFKLLMYALIGIPGFRIKGKPRRLARCSSPLEGRTGRALYGEKQLEISA